MLWSTFDRIHKKLLKKLLESPDRRKDSKSGPVIITTHLLWPISIVTSSGGIPISTQLLHHFVFNSLQCITSIRPLHFGCINPYIHSYFSMVTLHRARSMHCQWIRLQRIFRIDCSPWHVQQVFRWIKQKERERIHIPLDHPHFLCVKCSPYNGTLYEVVWRGKRRCRYK